VKKDFPEWEVKMADTDNELQRLAEADGAEFVRPWSKNQSEGLDLI
jgi:hypothetical protein